MSHNRNPVLKWPTQSHVKTLEGGRSYFWLGSSLTNRIINTRALIVTQVTSKGDIPIPDASSAPGQSNFLRADLTARGFLLHQWDLWQWRNWAPGPPTFPLKQGKRHQKLKASMCLLNVEKRRPQKPSNNWNTGPTIQARTCCFCRLIGCLLPQVYHVNVAWCTLNWAKNMCAKNRWMHHADS